MMRKPYIFALSCLLSTFIQPASAMDDGLGDAPNSSPTVKTSSSPSTFNPETSTFEIHAKWVNFKEKDKEILLPAVQRVSNEFKSLSHHDSSILDLLDVYKSNKKRDINLKEWAQKITDASAQTFKGIQNEKEFHLIITNLPLLDAQVFDVIFDESFFKLNATLVTQKDKLKDVLKDLGTIDLQHFKQFLKGVASSGYQPSMEEATTVRDLLSNHWPHIEKTSTIITFVELDVKYSLPQKFYFSKVMPSLIELMKKTPEAKMYGSQMAKALVMDPSSETVEKISQALTHENPEKMLRTIKRSGEHYADLKLKKHLLQETQELKKKMSKIDDKLTVDNTSSFKVLLGLMDLLMNMKGKMGSRPSGMNPFPFSIFDEMDSF